MPGLWNQQEWSGLIRFVSQMGISLELCKKKSTSEDLFSITCVFPPVSYFYTILLSGAAPLARWQLLLCWQPNFWILLSSVLWEMIFGSGVRTNRKKVPTALICGSKYVCLTKRHAKCYRVGAPPWTARGSHERICSSLSHLFTKAYSKQERETRIWFREEAQSCSGRPCLSELFWGWFWTGHELLFVITKILIFLHELI